jgi:hypothetical protein
MRRINAMNTTAPRTGDAGIADPVTAAQRRRQQGRDVAGDTE